MPELIGKLYKRRPLHLRDEEEAHRKAWDTRGRNEEATHVGITSARPGRANRDVFKHMAKFKAALTKIAGVRDAKVDPGLGAWEGGAEATWVVSYKGNGEARKLIAATAKQYDQDAVLFMSAATSAQDSEPLVEWTFDKPVSSDGRAALARVLVLHGMTGWTWYKRGGQHVLRSVSVPAWGGDAAAHLQASRDISQKLLALGMRHSRQVHPVKVRVLERSGEHSYDEAMK